MTMESNEVVKVAECGCCGMREDCTVDYIRKVKESFGGVWVCGLCEEAIKEEQARLGVGVDAAMLVLSKFRETTTVDPRACIARSLLDLLKKIISSTNTTTTTPSSQP